MADDFFTEGDGVQEEAPVERIKVGEEEFTQDELQRLVGLGKIGDEAEKKYKTRIDRVWPKYQQIINEKQEVEQKNREYEQKLVEAERLRQPQVQPNQGYTADQVRAEAIRQAKELGLVTKDEIAAEARRIAVEVQQGQRLIDHISGVIDQMTEDGLPSTTVEDVVTHMQETGIRDPEKAYKDMFEQEYLKSQAEKLASIKQKGIPTIKESVAGGKSPAPIRITGDNLETLVSEAIAGNY